MGAWGGAWTLVGGLTGRLVVCDHGKTLDASYTGGPAFEQTSAGTLVGDALCEDDGVENSFGGGTVVLERVVCDAIANDRVSNSVV